MCVCQFQRELSLLINNANLNHSHILSFTTAWSQGSCDSLHNMQIHHEQLCMFSVSINVYVFMFLTNTKTQTCNGTKKTINGSEKRARVYYVLLLCWNACNTLIYWEWLPLFALSSSMFCAFSRWSKTYNISPPRLNSNIGSVCIDLAMF